MFTAALFTIANMWKQPKCPWIGEWIKKMWYIHTMKYYSALKRKEILPYATTWINVEDIMLSERSQSQMDTYCMIPLTCGTKSQTQRAEWWLPGGGEQEKWGVAV